jgi:cytochrome c oxidase subunit 3
MGYQPSEQVEVLHDNVWSRGVIITKRGEVFVVKCSYSGERVSDVPEWRIRMPQLPEQDAVTISVEEKAMAEAKAGDHTPVVQLHLRYGMILFIASEVMFFVAFFWMFFDMALFHESRALTPEVGTWADTAKAWSTWPPKGVEVLSPWQLPLLNTVTLLLSGCTVTWAHHAIQVGDRKGAKIALGITVALGVLFTCVQAYEYHHILHEKLFFNEEAVNSGLYGSIFFMATGFHGFHVLIGTIFLAVCLIRLLAGDFTPQKHFGFEAAAWYWHFVDVVWIFLFFSIYIWGGWGAPIAGH